MERNVQGPTLRTRHAYSRQRVHPLEGVVVRVAIPHLDPNRSESSAAHPAGRRSHPKQTTKAPLRAAALRTRAPSSAAALLARVCAGLVARASALLLPRIAILIRVNSCGLVRAEAIASLATSVIARIVFALANRLKGLDEGTGAYQAVCFRSWRRRRRGFSLCSFRWR